MKRAGKAVSKLKGASPAKKTRKELVFLSSEDEMDITTTDKMVNWLEGIPGELWIIALETAGAGRLDFDWIQKFSLINKDCYRYTFSSELWRYLYESMLVAPAARPTHLLDDISNVSTPSYRALREESQIHYTFFLPYVFHFGLKTDSDGTTFETAEQVPEWKIWKRMVEVLRRRRVNIINKVALDTLDDPYVFDPTIISGYSDTSDQVRMGREEETGTSDLTLGTEYDNTNADIRRIPPAARPKAELNYSYAQLGSSDSIQDIHNTMLQTLDEGDIIVRSLPACPWPIIYGEDTVQGAWLGVLLPHKEIHAVRLGLVGRAFDRMRRLDHLFSLVAQPNGLLNVFCLGTTRDVHDTSMEISKLTERERATLPEEILVLMHTVRLDLLIRSALQRISQLDRINIISNVTWNNVPDFVVGKPRVFFSLSPTSVRFPSFPSSQWVANKALNHMPLAMSASRRYLAFTFHHGCQTFEWNYERVGRAGVVPYEFFNWEYLSDAANYFLPPVSPTEYADAEISQMYVASNTILPHLKLMMHAPDRVVHQNILDHPGDTADYLFNFPLSNRSIAPYPANGVTKHVDVAEIRCDPLGSNRFIAIIGICHAEVPIYENREKEISYYHILYFAMGLVLHPKLTETRFNYIGYYETRDRPAFDDVPNRMLRDSIDGVVIMVPTPLFIKDANNDDDDDDTRFSGVTERVETSIVAWIDVSDKRRRIPVMTTFTHTVTSAFMSKMNAWEYLPCGLLITAQTKITKYNEIREETTVQTSFNFMLPVRGGWRARVDFRLPVRGGWQTRGEQNKHQVISRRFTYRFATNEILRTPHSMGVMLFAGGNTFMQYDLLRFYRSEQQGLVLIDYTLFEGTLNVSSYELGPSKDNARFVTYVRKGNPTLDPLTAPSSPGLLAAHENLDELIDGVVGENSGMVPRPGANNYLSSTNINKSLK